MISDAIEIQPRIEKGDWVMKKSHKPFKSKNQIEQVIAFGTNALDPKKRICVYFGDGSCCNLDLLIIVDK